MKITYFLLFFMIISNYKGPALLALIVISVCQWWFGQIRVMVFSDTKAIPNRDNDSNGLNIFSDNNVEIGPNGFKDIRLGIQILYSPKYTPYVKLVKEWKETLMVSDLYLENGVHYVRVFNMTSKTVLISSIATFAQIVFMKNHRGRLRLIHNPESYRT